VPTRLVIDYKDDFGRWTAEWEPHACRERRHTRRTFPEWRGLDGDGEDLIVRLRLTFDVAQARWASRQAA